MRGQTNEASEVSRNENDKNGRDQRRETHDAVPLMPQHSPVEASTGASSSRVIAVVGAGRSGTSVTTRAIGALGVELGNRLKPGTPKNAKGFFEDEPLLEINVRLRSHFGIKRSGSTVTVIREHRCTGDDPVIEKLKSSAVQTIRERFSDYPVWGFKSGGTVAFLPFWEDVFRRADCHPSYVLALRNPLAVARSRAKLNPGRGSHQRSDLEWLVRNVPYLRRMAESPLVCLDFDLLMAQPREQLERIARVLELPTLASAQQEDIREFSEDFLSPKLHHNRVACERLDDNPDLDPLARDAYRWLRRMAEDEIDTSDPRSWREWSRIEDRLVTLEPTLRHLDEVEAEVRRHRFSRPGILDLVRSRFPGRRRQ